ncbi:MAG: ATP-binding protein [Candidatus Eremiobacteraeota bacterium]|nr:ATP-binding protein [Candidatus Eremiobacteraeota bacterium]
MSGRYSATYRSEPKNVAIARSAVANFARSCGFDGREVSEIELAAGEALSNAAEHGLQRDGGSFTVRCSCQGNELVIEVRDTGRGFQQTAPVQPPDVIPSRGFGMTIMRAFMNTITYSENGTVVRLTRRRDTAEDGNGHGAT